MNQIPTAITKTERVDESFYFDTKSSYNLTLQLDECFFRAVAYSNEREKFVMQAEFLHDNDDTTLNEIVSKTDFLNREYKDVRCIVDSAQHTLIPKPLFAVNDAEQWLAFNANLAPDHLIYHNYIPSIDAYIVFAIRSTIVAMIRRKFPDVIFLHAASPLIGYGLSHYRIQSQTSMLIQVHPSSLEVCLIAGGKLLLYNTFTYQSDEDFIYYPLFIVEQFSLQPEDLQVKFGGCIAKEMPKFELFWKYFQSVDFYGKDSRSEYSYRLADEINSHRYLALFAARLCE